MIKKLKRKFISTVMLCVFCVFMVLLIAINVFFSYNLTSTSDSLLNLLVSGDMMQPFEGEGEGGVFERDNMKPMPEAEGVKADYHALSPVPETKNSMRYFIVEIDDSGNVIKTDTQKISSVTEDEAINMALEAEKNENGKIKWYGDYRYASSATESGYKMVFLNCEMVRYSLNSLMLYSVLIAIAAYIIILLIIVPVSGKVIKPIAESYNKQKQFITDAGHELKTPLTIISANNELQELNGNKSEYTKNISDEITQLTELVNQLVNLSRFDEENLDAVTNEFSLSDAVYDTASAFSSVIERSQKKLEINITPNIKYTGDEEKIRRLVSILMDNAVKYCDDKGTIKVELSHTKRVNFVVSNTYAQVKNVELSRLFDRFYREDKARTSGNGYGLGLSIAKSIVQLHHGTIKAKNKDNCVIEFCVTL